MILNIFSTQVCLEPESEWIESSNCNVTNVVDLFRELDSDDSYIYTEQDGVAIVISIDDMQSLENSIYFVNLNTKECKHVQSHKFLYLFEKILQLNPI